MSPSEVRGRWAMLIVNVLGRSRRFDKPLSGSRCNLSNGRELTNTKNKESLNTGGLEMRRFAMCL